MILGEYTLLNAVYIVEIGGFEYFREIGIRGASPWALEKLQRLQMQFLCFRLPFCSVRSEEIRNMGFSVCPLMEDYIV